MPTNFLIAALILGPILMIGIAIYRTIRGRPIRASQGDQWWPWYDYRWVVRWLGAVFVYFGVLYASIPLLGTGPVSPASWDRVAIIGSGTNVIVVVACGVAVCYWQFRYVCILAGGAGVVHALWLQWMLR